MTKWTLSQFSFKRYFLQAAKNTVWRFHDARASLNSLLRDISCKKELEGKEKLVVSDLWLSILF